MVLNLPNSDQLKPILKKLFLGQLIAICLSLTAVSQTNLNDLKFNVTTEQVQGGSGLM